MFKENIVTVHLFVNEKLKAEKDLKIVERAIEGINEVILEKRISIRVVI